MGRVESSSFWWCASLLLCLGCVPPETADGAGQPPPPTATAEQENVPTATDANEIDVNAIVSALHDGIDVSTHSGMVSWPEVAAAGHGFAFMKATEGVDLADSAFATNWIAAKDAGLVRGAYHFYVTEDDPDQQADFFISVVSLEAGDLAPVVDIELIGHNTQPGLTRLTGHLQQFLDRLEAHYGIKPIIYTMPNFWNEHLGDGFGGYPLWVAEYEVDQPRLPKGWAAWHLWQWQADADIPGVEKGADLNKANRHGPNLADLVLVP